jgi:NACalpha-BTF3-like transcription factor
MEQKTTNNQRNKKWRKRKRIPHGLTKLVAERTGYSRETVMRALRGERDSIHSRLARKAAAEIMDELGIA